MKKQILIDMTDVDWALLRKQKAALIEAAGDRECELLEGLVHLLDDIQDQAALGIGSYVIFGRS